jgi:hypothetical protein
VALQTIGRYGIGSTSYARATLRSPSGDCSGLARRAQPKLNASSRRTRRRYPACGRVSTQGSKDLQDDFPPPALPGSGIRGRDDFRHQPLSRPTRPTRGLSRAIRVPAPPHAPQAQSSCPRTRRSTMAQGPFVVSAPMSERPDQDCLKRGAVRITWKAPVGGDDLRLGARRSRIRPTAPSPHPQLRPVAVATRSQEPKLLGRGPTVRCSTTVSEDEVNRLS